MTSADRYVERIGGTGIMPVRSSVRAGCPHHPARENQDRLMELKPHLSIVAPCYNEQEVLGEFARRALAAGQSLGRPFEIVLVNDGSTDGTWAMMNDLAARQPEVIAVNLSRNHGHQRALTAGLAVCRGEWVFILDADLQDPPELLSAMIEKARAEEADVVYGVRRTRPHDTPFKRATTMLFYRILDRLADTRIPLDTGDFRLMSRRALDVLNAMPEQHRFLRGMISWIGYRQVALEYDRDARFAGETKYPFRKLLRLAIDGVTSFSIKPLRLAAYLGLLTGVFAVILVIYAVISWWLRSPLQGWASLMAGVALLGSVQLFVLGVIGEYLGRLYEQAKGRPLFVIDRIVRGGGGGGGGNAAAPLSTPRDQPRSAPQTIASAP
jgi:dolichol-phosphate mannosyltransferase